MTPYLQVAVCAFISAFVFSTDQAPPPREVATSYFPTSLGTKWIYEDVRHVVTSQQPEVLVAKELLVRISTA